MVTKALVVVVILFLLRSHMGIIKPFWPLCVGLAVGAFAGWWLMTLAVDTGADFSVLEQLGCPRRLIKPVVALLGALMAAGPVSTAIRGLFPCEDKK